MGRELLSLAIAAWISAFLAVSPVLAATPCPCCITAAAEQAECRHCEPVVFDACCEHGSAGQPSCGNLPSHATRGSSSGTGCPHCELKSQQRDVPVSSSMASSGLVLSTLVALTAERGTFEFLVPPSVGSRDQKPRDLTSLTPLDRLSQLCRWLT